MSEKKYLTILEAVSEGMEHGNNTLIPFDFIVNVAKSFDAPLIAIKGFEVETEKGEYKSIKIDFKL